MPKQELFLREELAGRVVEVLKTYDPAYAREAFDEMDDDAQLMLWNSLDIEQNYESADLPSASDPGRTDFLWDELMDSAREDVRLDPNLRSFFVVNEIRGKSSRSLYVSADWPSAERFARGRLGIASPPGPA